MLYSCFWQNKVMMMINLIQIVNVDTSTYIPVWPVKPTGPAGPGIPGPPREPVQPVKPKEPGPPCCPRIPGGPGDPGEPGGPRAPCPPVNPTTYHQPLYSSLESDSRSRDGRTSTISAGRHRHVF